tara:strand:+ start:198 stop:1034 length:837 start_codon:yes stop_codon:yes gene_type:complete
MNIFFRIILFVAIILLSNCNKNKDTKLEIIQEKKLEDQMVSAYNDGVAKFNEGDAILAAKKFNEAEILFPQSEWAPKAALMSAYSYFTYSYYSDSIFELKRFINKYPNHSQLDYAYYLLAMSYYEQIIDETRDIEPLLEAKKNFNVLITNFPETDFALDADYKIGLIDEILASKEMYIARYYLDRAKWIPAINRYKVIVNDYDSSIYIDEALHRLVEIHYKIGLESEAQKYAKLLGYNYLSSEWYKKSYKVLNKNYKSPKINKKRKSSLLKKFKSLLE